MIRNKDGMKIFYDQEADVLYVTRGKPAYTDYVEHSDDVVLRVDPETQQLVGFTIIDFSQHFAKDETDIMLPFGVNFQMYEDVSRLN